MNVENKHRGEKIIGNFLKPCAYKEYNTQTKKGNNNEKQIPISSAVVK